MRPDDEHAVARVHDEVGGLSYSVAQRTREIGVRTALGATPRHILNMVLRQGGLMVIVGAGLTVVDSSPARFLRDLPRESTR